MDDQPRSKRFTRDWTDIVRRAQFDKAVPGTHPGTYIKASTVTMVAIVMASYANPDGTRVFPGVALLAADCKIGYSVAGRCVKGLRDLGLIERVRRAVRRNPRSDRERTDEYRLAIPEDLLERLFVPTPSDHGKRAAVIAKPHRGELAATLEPPDPTTQSVTSERPDPAESNSAFGASPDGSNTAFRHDLTLPTAVATYPETVTTSTTSHSGEDVSYDAAAPRAPEAEAEDPNFDGVAEQCPPSLRVVTGGGETSPAPPALWPVALPTLPAEEAIAMMRANLADAQTKVKQRKRRRA